MKILITYATAGVGHKKAAEALYHGLCDGDEHEVVYMDALEYTTTIYRHFYCRTYTFLVSYILPLPLLPTFLSSLLHTFPTFYRTIFELKLFRSLAFSLLVTPFNRSLFALHLVCNFFVHGRLFAFNRTILALKLRPSPFISALPILLIEPFWN